MDTDLDHMTREALPIFHTEIVCARLKPVPPSTPRPYLRAPPCMTHFAGLDEKKALHSWDTPADTYIMSA